MAKNRWESAPVVGDTSKPKWMDAPTVGDATTTTTFNPTKPKATTLTEDVVNTAVKYAPYAMPSMLGSIPPQQMAKDAGTALEMGLPLLATPLPPMLRTPASGLLQGVGTMLKRGMTDITGATQPNVLGYGNPKAPEMFTQGLESAGIGMASMAVPELGMGVFNKARAPFANMVNPEVTNLGKQYGVPLSASALSKSRAVPLLESLTGKGMFGNQMERLVETGGNRINQIMDKAVASFGKSTVPTDVGLAIENGYNGTKTVFDNTKKALYEAANLKNAKIPVDVSPTIDFLNSKIEELSGIAGQKPEVLQELIKLRNGLKDPSGMVAKLESQNFDKRTIQRIMQQKQQEGLTADKIQTTIRHLDSQINFKNPAPVVRGYEGIVKKVAETLNADLDAGIKLVRPDLSDALDRANQYYKEGVTKLNSAFGKKINDYIKKDKTSEIVPAILNRNTPVEYVPQIFELIGDDAKKSIQASALERIVEKARRGSDYFTEYGLQGQIKSYGNEKLQAIFGKDVTKILRDAAKLSTAWNTSKKVSEGSQTGFIMRTLGEVGLLISNPVLAAKMVFGDVEFSKFISSKTGQQWRTTGFSRIPQTTVAGISNATRIGASELVDEQPK